jgi:hypothetical protein
MQWENFLYKPVDGHLYQENIWTTGTFWVQREAITNVSGWGSSMSCPCQYKKIKSIEYANDVTYGNNSTNNSKKKSARDTAETCHPNLLPERGLHHATLKCEAFFLYDNNNSFYDKPAICIIFYIYRYYFMIFPIQFIINM